MQSGLAFYVTGFAHARLIIHNVSLANTQYTLRSEHLKTYFVAPHAVSSLCSVEPAII